MVTSHQQIPSSISRTADNFSFTYFLSGQMLDLGARYRQSLEKPHLNSDSQVLWGKNVFQQCIPKYFCLQVFALLLFHGKL